MRHAHVHDVCKLLARGDSDSDNKTKTGRERDEDEHDEEDRSLTALLTVVGDRW